MVTTFPDFRQKFMKNMSNFLTRLRTVHYKDVKKGIHDPQFISFLG
jgi:hypothetical protein